jgi:hypothetical protein
MKLKINEDEETVSLRVLAEEAPTTDAVAATPNLEDYYLYVFGEQLEKTT